MRLKGFKICECGALKDLHVGGSGHCEAALAIPAHKHCKCLKFIAVKGGSKFANVVRTPQGDSGEERDRGAMLRMLEKGGALRELRAQHRLDITPDGGGYEQLWFKVDFSYQERIGGKWVQVYEDWKGNASWGEASRLKVALLMGKFCSGGRGVMRISYTDSATRRMVVQDMRTSYTVRKNRKGHLYAGEPRKPRRAA